MSASLLFHVEFEGIAGAARYSKSVDFIPRTGDFVIIGDGKVTIRPRVDAVEWLPPKQYGTPSKCLAVLRADHPLAAREKQAVESDGWARLP
jgi:hypothetical protein